jgi:Tfp pilus assembly protein PilF
MRSSLLLLVLALAACSSPPPPQEPSPEAKERARAVAYLIEEGAALNEKGRFRDAATTFMNACVIEPSNVKAQYDLALALENAKDWKGAALGFARVLELSPLLAPAHHHLAEVRLEQGDRAAARTELERTVSIDPALAAAWIDLAGLDVEEGHPDAATRRLEKATATADTAAVWYHLGLARELAADKKGAGTAYEHALRLDPKHAPCLNNLAVLAETRGDLETALGFWQGAIAASPGYPPAEKNLGIALYKRKNQGYLALPHFEAYLRAGGTDQRVPPWVREIKDASRTFRTDDRAFAIFDRTDRGMLVTADGSFPYRDPRVGEKAASLQKGDRVRLFFESGVSPRVVDIAPAR